MKLDLQHEKALIDLEIPLGDYPMDIRQSIKSIKAVMKRKGVDPQTENENVPDADIININAMSARIADDMQNFYERDFEEENQNNNTMLTPEEIECAKAVNLDETATVEQIEAAEMAAKEAAEALKVRAKNAGLDETATLDQIEVAEASIAKTQQEAADAAAAALETLKARAIAVNLPETATEAEIVAAETAAEEERKRQEEAARNPPPAPKPKHYLDDFDDIF